MTSVRALIEKDEELRQKKAVLPLKTPAAIDDLRDEIKTYVIDLELKQRQLKSERTRRRLMKIANEWRAAVDHLVVSSHYDLAKSSPKIDPILSRSYPRTRPSNEQTSRLLSWILHIGELITHSHSRERLHPEYLSRWEIDDPKPRLRSDDKHA